MRVRAAVSAGWTGQAAAGGLDDLADAADPSSDSCFCAAALYFRHMEFGIPGPLFVSMDGRELRLAAPPQRTLLAGGAAAEAVHALGQALGSCCRLALADFRYEEFARSEPHRWRSFGLSATVAVPR